MQDEYFNRKIKAARALLLWKQEDLAVKSNVSIATIRKLEQAESLADINVNTSTLSLLKYALEANGITFIEPKLDDKNNVISHGGIILAQPA